MEVIKATLHEEPMALDQMLGINPDLEDLIFNMLAKERDSRPKSAEEVYQKLTKIHEREPEPWSVDPTIIHKARQKPKLSRERSQILKTLGDGPIEP